MIPTELLLTIRGKPVRCRSHGLLSYAVAHRILLRQRAQIFNYAVRFTCPLRNWYCCPDRDQTAMPSGPCTDGRIRSSIRSAARDYNHQCIIRYFTRDNCPGTDECKLPDVITTDNCGIGTDAGTSVNNGLGVFISAIDGTARDWSHW